MKWLNCEKMKTLLIGVVAAVVLSGGIAKADFTWTQKADMPIKRTDHSTCVVDGKIYVIGGWHAIGEWNPQWEALTRVDVYDPATDTWTRKADMPTARGYTNACVVDGKIYVIGGDTNPDRDFSIPDVEVYDPVADTWTQKADMPTNRYWFSTCAVDGIIYVIGGSRPGNILNTVEAYDTLTDTWTTKAHMPTERKRLSTCVVDGLIYAIGGDFQGLRCVEVYDPATDTWTQKTLMPTGRTDLDVVVVCGKVYAIGGWQHSVQGPIYSTVEVYDPFTDTWSSGVDIPVTTAGLSTSVVDGKIYVMGGATETIGVGRNHWVLTSAVYEYKPLNLPPDFNNDFKIDIEDLIILIEHWGQEEPCFDIAPLPSGDGIVDEADLEVFMSYWGQEFDDPSLIAHWKLDETEGDIAYDSASEHDGTLNGEPLWQPEGGMVDGAIELDGIDDYISTPFVLNPGRVDAFSVFAWIKGGAPGQVIISQENGADWLLADPSEGRLMTDLKEAGRFGKSLISDAVITDGAWHRIGLIWDGRSRILYVDDVEVASDTQGDFAGSNEGLYIGVGKALETGSFWFGLIDDVKIYSRAVTP